MTKIETPSRFMNGLADPRFWLSVLAMVVAVVIGWANLRSQVSSAIARAESNYQQLVRMEQRRQTQDSLMVEMRRDVTDVVKAQRQSYELLRAIAEKNGIWVPPPPSP